MLRQCASAIVASHRRHPERAHVKLLIERLVSKVGLLRRTGTGRRAMLDTEDRASESSSPPPPEGSDENREPASRPGHALAAATMARAGVTTQLANSGQQPGAGGSATQHGMVLQPTNAASQGLLSCDRKRLPRTAMAAVLQSIAEVATARESRGAASGSGSIAAELRLAGDRKPEAKSTVATPMADFDDIDEDVLLEAIDQVEAASQSQPQLSSRPHIPPPHGRQGAVCSAAAQDRPDASQAVVLLSPVDSLEKSETDELAAGESASQQTYASAEDHEAGSGQPFSPLGSADSTEYPSAVANTLSRSAAPTSMAPAAAPIRSLAHIAQVPLPRTSQPTFVAPARSFERRPRSTTAAQPSASAAPASPFPFSAATLSLLVSAEPSSAGAATSTCQVEKIVQQPGRRWVPAAEPTAAESDDEEERVRGPISASQWKRSSPPQAPRKENSYSSDQGHELPSPSRTFEDLDASSDQLFQVTARAGGAEIHSIFSRQLPTAAVHSATSSRRPSDCSSGMDGGDAIPHEFSTRPNAKLAHMPSSPSDARQLQTSTPQPKQSAPGPQDMTPAPTNMSAWKKDNPAVKTLLKSTPLSGASKNPAGPQRKSDARTNKPTNKPWNTLTGWLVKG